MRVTRNETWVTTLVMLNIILQPLEIIIRFMFPHFNNPQKCDRLVLWIFLWYYYLTALILEQQAHLCSSKYGIIIIIFRHRDEKKPPATIEKHALRRSVFSGAASCHARRQQRKISRCSKDFQKFSLGRNVNLWKIDSGSAWEIQKSTVPNMSRDSKKISKTYLETLEWNFLATLNLLTGNKDAHASHSVFNWRNRR